MKNVYELLNGSEKHQLTFLFIHQQVTCWNVNGVVEFIKAFRSMWDIWKAAHENEFEGKPFTFKYPNETLITWLMIA